MLGMKIVAWLICSPENVLSAPTFASGQSYSQYGAPWGLARLSHPEWAFDDDGNTFDTNPNNAYFYHETGNPVTVYMLDTGVDINHTEFGGRAVFGFNFVGDGSDSDDNGHGTHLAGTAIGNTKGVARAATLVSVKILDAQREGTIENFSKAVDWVINDNKSRGGKAVINYSAVGDVSEFRADAISRAASNGIFVVNAAGNAGANACDYGPANMGPNFSGMLVVAALNWTNAPADFSNYGSCVDIWAPGVDIDSSLLNGGYGYMDGTSNAAAFVSGLAAYLWGENPNLSLSELNQIIRNANPDVVNSAGTTGAVSYNYYFS